MSKLFGYLSYRDVEVAITWLETLGFETTTRQQDDGGATVHAELRLGDAVVMVAPADEPYETPKLIGRSTGRGLYLLVDDVTTLHGAAPQAGGSSVFAPDKTEWGTERARVLDPEGLRVVLRDLRARRQLVSAGRSGEAAAWLTAGGAAHPRTSNEQMAEAADLGTD